MPRRLVVFDEYEWSQLIDARVNDTARLRAVSDTAALDTDAEESFDRLTTLAGTVLDVPFAFVTLVDDRRSFWKSCFGLDSANLDERQNPVGESFCQYVVATGETLLVEDTRLDRRTSGNPSIESMGVLAWAGSPLLSADGEVLGTFCAVSDRPRPWTRLDARLLETLAGAAASELRLRAALVSANAVSADLELQLRMRERLGERGAYLAELAKDLATASSAEQVSRVVAASAPGALGAQFVTVDLVDATGTHMTVIHSPSVPTTIVERYSTIVIDESTAPGCAILRREPAYARSFAEFAAKWPEVADDARSVGVESVAAWPLLRADGTVMGALSVAWSTEIEFTPLLRSALLTMTQMCAAALERGQVGDSHHGLIRALQRALLPPIPQIAGLDVAARYVPANHHLGFGGDWYDVFAVSETLTAVVVGDVCGHGIAAAATMAQLRGLINALARLKIDALSELFDDAEDWLVESPDFIATVAIHVIDLVSNTVRYVSAGHPPALVVLPDGTTAALDQGRRPVFGVRGPRPAVASAPFPSGGVLVASTDGLLEGTGKSWDVAAAELAACVVGLRAGSAATIADALEQAIDWVPSDDIAYVVARRS